MANNAIFDPPTKDELAIKDKLFAPPSNDELAKVGQNNKDFSILDSINQKQKVTPANLGDFIKNNQPFDQDMRPSGKAPIPLPSGYDVASKITDNPYVGTAIATAYDASPLALGFLGNKNKMVGEGPMKPTPELIENQRIIDASKRIGTQATPGMLSNSESVQGLENSLSQSPTIGGWLTRLKTRPVYDAMENTSEGLLKEASPNSPFESGEKAKDSIKETTENKFKEPARLFESLRQYTKDIPSTPRSTTAVSRNIMNIPDVAISGSPDASIAKMVSDSLGKNPTADQIKSLRTMVGRKGEAIENQGGDASGIWDIYGRLSRLEENTIKRGAIQSARTSKEGETIAQGMLGQLRSAKEGWSSGMEDIQDLSQAAGLKQPKNPSHFQNILDAIKSEQLQEKLLPLNDVRAGQTLHEFSPKAADELRRARIRDIKDRASDTNGELSASGLLRSTKNLNPETEQMLFGNDKGLLEDLRTVNGALPEKVGPSGTPKGQSYLHGDTINPWSQGRDLLKYLYYRSLGGNAPMLSDRPIGVENIDPYIGAATALKKKNENK